MTRWVSAWVSALGLCLSALMLPAAPALAQQDLGIFSSWGAFRDAAVPLCYAIARPEQIAGKAERKAYVDFGFWPDRALRGQFHARLSRDRSSNARVTVSIAGHRFALKSDRADAWSQDADMDRAIIRALRRASSMTVESVGRDGRPIVDAYLLKGAASAIDAAALGCKQG